MSTALSSSNPKHDDTATGSSSLAGNKRQAEDVLKAIKKVNDEIDEVNHQIKEIEKKLENPMETWTEMVKVGKHLGFKDAGDWATRLRDKEKQLRDDKKQLRKKEEQLRDTLNKLLDKEKGLSNPTPAKKPCIDQAPDSEQDVFFSVVPKTTVNKGLVTFAKQILGSKDSSTTMYKRACYDQLYNMIKDNFRKAPRERRKSVVVMGSPGTGKSWCAFYVLYDFIKRGKTVLYVRDSTGDGVGGSGYLYAPPDCPLLKLLREKGYDIPESDPATNWVGVVKLGTGEGARFMRRFEMLSGGYVILDPSKGGIMVPEAYQCKLIVFSSPHRQRMNNAKNSCLQRFMPLWTLDELKKANDTCSLGFDDEQLCDRFNVFGGIARHVFCRAAGQFESRLDLAVGNLTEASAKSILQPMSDNTDESGMLVHMTVSDTLDKYTTQVASQRVLNKIGCRAIDTKSLFLLAWVRQCQGLGCYSAAGEILELFLHKELLNLSKDGWMWRKLTDDASAELDRVMAKSGDMFPKGPVVFHKLDLTDLLCSWEVGHYCWPSINNFPTLDSFAVVKGGSPFEPSESSDSNQLSVIGFQMTIGRSHSLLMKGYKLVYDACCKRFNQNGDLTIKLYLVWFVSYDVRGSWKKKIKFTLKKGAANSENTSDNTEWFDREVTQIVLSHSSVTDAGREIVVPVSDKE